MLDQVHLLRGLRPVEAQALVAVVVLPKVVVDGHEPDAVRQVVAKLYLSFELEYAPVDGFPVRPLVVTLLSTSG